MKTILKIQKIDIEIENLKKAYSNNKMQSQIQELNKYRVEGRDFLSKTEVEAEALMKEYNKINAQYTKMLEKTAGLENQDLAETDIEDLQKVISQTNNITAEISSLENKLKYTSDKMQGLLKDYNNAMNQMRVAKERTTTLKAQLEKISNENNPKIEALQSEIDDLKKNADKKILSLYEKMRKDNILPPIFVPINNNRCARCGMEFSTDFIDVIAKGGVHECENCHRYIYLEK